MYIHSFFESSLVKWTGCNIWSTCLLLLITNIVDSLWTCSVVLKSSHLPPLTLRMFLNCSLSSFYREQHILNYSLIRCVFICFKRRIERVPCKVVSSTGFQQETDAVVHTCNCHLKLVNTHYVIFHFEFPNYFI